MNISISCAHSIYYFRKKTQGSIFVAILFLPIICYEFIQNSNTIYELIYLSEFIIAFFQVLVVSLYQLYQMYSTSYILSMSYLINETGRLNLQTTNQELEEMINQKRRLPISRWSIFYTIIKMCFHNYCCESKDFLQLFLSFGIVVLIVIQYLLWDVWGKNMLGYYFLLTYIILQDVIPIILGFIIEMPRRIRQSYKRRALQRRATQQQFQSVDLQIQAFGNNFSEGQQGLREDLLQYQQMNEQRIEVRQVQNGMQAQDEQIFCAICSEDMNVNSNIQKLQCHPSHIFHSQCINNWFQTNRQQNKVPSCPICRAPQNG